MEYNAGLYFVQVSCREDDAAAQDRSRAAAVDCLVPALYRRQRFVEEGVFSTAFRRERQPCDGIPRAGPIEQGAGLRRKAEHGAAARDVKLAGKSSDDVGRSNQLSRPGLARFSPPRLGFKGRCR